MFADVVLYRHLEVPQRVPYRDELAAPLGARRRRRQLLDVVGGLYNYGIYIVMGYV